MASTNSLKKHPVLEKLNQCEQKLAEILASFEELVQASINLYESPPENPDLPNEMSKQGEDIATKLKDFGILLSGALKDLPNDEPIRPNPFEFDEFIIDFMKTSIMDKIRQLSNLIPKSQR